MDMNAAQPSGRKTFSESLQSLDIFTLLGVSGTDEEKEAFLQEIQDIIWQDVIETDLMPMLSEADISTVEKTLDDEALSLDAKRDKLFEMIMDRLPNAEEVLLDRTMELKSDLLHERLEGLKEFYKDNAAAQQELQRAHQMVDAGQHAEAAAVLNQLKA